MNSFRLLWIVLFSALSISVLGNPIHKQLQLSLKKDKSVEFSLFKESRTKRDNLKSSKTLQIDKVKLSRLYKSKPNTLTLNLPNSGNPFKVDLFKVEILTEDFKIRTSSGKNIEFREAIFYRGAIRGDTNSIVSVSIFNDNLSAVISNKEGNWDLGKFGDTEDYIIYNTNELQIPFECSTNESRIQSQSPISEQSVSGCRTLRVYIECDFDLYTKRGSSIPNVSTFVTGLFSQVATVYANENIPIQLSEIFVWTTTDPYISQTTSTSVLTLFRTTRTTFNGDLAHLISTRAANQGGVAYLDVLCSTSFKHAYSNIYNTFQLFPTYSWSVSVFAHEMGHNLGSNHTQWCGWSGGALDNCFTTEGGCPTGPAPIGGGTIMSYCHLTQYGINLSRGFGVQPGDKIRSRFNSATCLSGASLSISPTSAVTCQGSSISLTASGGTTYTWTPSTGLNTTTGSTVIATPQTTTTYTVTSTVGSCTASASKTVTVLTTPNYGTLTSNNQTFVNSGDPSVINFSTSPSGATSFTYQWYSRSGINSQPTGTSTSGWTPITGAIFQTYDPPVQNSSITFAVQVDPVNSPDCYPTTWANGVRVITVNTSNGFSSGTLNSGDQTFCFGGGDPSPISFSTPPQSSSGTTSSNLITQPEQITSPYWIFEGCSSSSNFSTSPDGTNSAERITESQTTGLHRFYSPIISTSGTITSSIYVKPSGTTCVGLYLGNFNSIAIAKFQLSGSGSVFSTNSNVISASITLESNGWYRISAKSLGDASYRFRLYLHNSSCAESYLGSSTAGVQVWGAKVESGDLTPYFASSTLNYQWYSRTGVNSQPTGNSTTGWTIISGANSISFDPPSVSTTTTYACLVSSGSNSAWATGVRQITVLPQFNPGVISSGDETFCQSGNPSNITLSQNPTGSGAYQWRWYFKESASSTCPTGSSITGWSTNNTSVNITGTSLSGSGISFDPTSAGTLNNGRTFAVLITPISSGNVPACGVPTWASSCRKTYVVSCTLPADTVCTEWFLGEARPNPSTQFCSIDVVVPSGHSGVLAFFDSQGQKFSERSLSQGEQTLLVNVSEWPTGIYYYTIFEDSGLRLSQKMVVLK